MAVGGLGKCSKIRHIVHLRQLLRRWRNKAAASSSRIPSDIPPGHVAVSVGADFRRFIIPASYLNHPVFRQLLNRAEEEYGFGNSIGPLAIPCNESVFEEILRFMVRFGSEGSSRFVKFEDFQRGCNMSVRDFRTEVRPLVSEENLW
uniref:Small auxin up regulated protein n=1 Tax=Kalanchoe fedtschenkoi TaxID=63787 RepID=A0A7N0V5I6_KALFE